MNDLILHRDYRELSQQVPKMRGFVWFECRLDLGGMDPDRFWAALERYFVNPMLLGPVGDEIPRASSCRLLQATRHNGTVIVAGQAFVPVQGWGITTSYKDGSENGRLKIRSLRRDPEAELWAVPLNKLPKIEIQ